MGRTRSFSAAAESGPPSCGRLKQGRGGRGGRGSEASTSRSTDHIGLVAFEFVVDLDCRPHSWLYLSDSFAMAMVNRRPAGFWLQVDGCPNGPSWVLTEYASDDAILLGKGWKSFARFRRLTRGLYVAFQFDGDQTLLVKIYRTAGGRVK